MSQIKFSIIVVCLNPAEKLNQTINSILCQSYDNYEVIVKDGGSRDGSIEGMRQDKHIRLFQEKDTGIYDAMNQAVSHAEGDYILFLNCGDTFFAEKVLEKVAESIGQCRESSCLKVFYGNTYSLKNDVLIQEAPEITGFTCYRNIPCHQSCFYAAQLCREKPYDLQYRIRADYDHFLWCYYVAKAEMVCMNLTVSSYEGGGYSESKENRKRDNREHRLITTAYLGKGELFRYRLIMAVTLAPLRKMCAENKWFSGFYQGLKKKIYGRNRKK